jgi:hypothetical protein
MSDLDSLSPPVEGGGGPDSPLTTLRARRKQIHADTTKDFPIPGFGGELVCRYRVLPFEEFKQIERKALLRGEGLSTTEAALNAYMDELIEACVGFYVKVSGKLEPGDPDRPVRYDNRLADLLGYGPVSSAREALRGLFVEGNGEARSGWAIEVHHTMVLTWMAGNPEDPDDEGAQGEAEAAFAGE